MGSVAGSWFYNLYFSCVVLAVVSAYETGFSDRLPFGIIRHWRTTRRYLHVWKFDRL